MNVFRQSLKWLLAACVPAERWLVRGRRARTVAGPAISLTFDDGPHPEITPLILDRLQMFGWKGTFFVIGERALQHPQLIRRIVNEGHELGTHSWTHSEPAATSATKLIEETRSCEQLLKEICGADVSLMRPPKGELTFRKLAGLWRQLRTLVLWNVDPRDYRPDSELELRRWAACYTPRHGDIVLLHDVSSRAMDVLDQLQEHRRLVGVETVTISAWMPDRSATEHSDEQTLQAHGKSEGLRCQ